MRTFPFFAREPWWSQGSEVEGSWGLDKLELKLAWTQYFQNSTRIHHAPDSMGSKHL